MNKRYPASKGRIYLDIKFENDTGRAYFDFVNWAYEIREAKESEEKGTEST